MRTLKGNELPIKVSSTGGSGLARVRGTCKIIFYSAEVIPNDLHVLANHENMILWNRLVGLTIVLPKQKASRGPSLGK